MAINGLKGSNNQLLLTNKFRKNAGILPSFLLPGRKLIRETVMALVLERSETNFPIYCQCLGRNRNTDIPLVPGPVSRPVCDTIHLDWAREKVRYGGPYMGRALPT